MDPAECFVPTFLVRGGTAEEPQNFTWLYRQRNVATRLDNNLPRLAYHVDSCAVKPKSTGDPKQEIGTKRK